MSTLQEMELKLADATIYLPGFGEIKSSDGLPFKKEKSALNRHCYVRAMIALDTFQAVTMPYYFDVDEEPVLLEKREYLEMALKKYLGGCDFDKQDLKKINDLSSKAGVKK